MPTVDNIQHATNVKDATVILAFVMRVGGDKKLAALYVAAELRRRRHKPRSAFANAAGAFRFSR
jgi:hypothetical protein